MEMELAHKNGLPEGWQWKRLGEICSQPQYGYTTSGSNEGDVKLLRTTDITSGELNWTTVPFCKENPKDVGKYLLRDGDIVISRAGSVGVSFLIRNPEPSVFASYLIRFKPHEHIISKELFYQFLQSPLYWNEITEKSLGIAVPNVNASKLKEILVPVPPVTEQQRIVAKIEELFSELEAGKAALERATQGLKLYRQAVLKWAFEGKLTNADVVDGELPDGWKSLPLKEIVTEKDGLRRGPFGSAIKKEFFVPTGYKVYEQGNAINDDPYRGKYFIDEEKYKELINFKALPGDLLVSCSGVTLGRITALPEDALPGIINQALLRIRLKPDLVSKSYFIYYFRAAFFQQKIFENSQGTGMPNLVGIKDFKEIHLLIPPLEEQHRIVQEIESRLSVCDKIEATIAASLQQAEALRQSILKKAFDGKLVKQKRAKIVPFFPAVEEDSHLRKVFASYIISRCYKDRYFGRVVFQKMLHLAEYHCQLDYETHYLKQAAGPMDKFIYRLIKEAAEKDWFTVYERGKQQRFEPGARLPELLQDYAAHFAPYNDRLEQMFRLMKGRNMDEAELFSTVYAVWNNCIIQAATPDKDRTVREVHAWSDRKEKFNEAQIWDAKGVLERAGLAPLGFGNVIEKH